MFEKKLSFVIPCYYSEKTIELVVTDIVSEFPKSEYNKEIILVNDGSKDNTASVIKSLSDANSDIISVNLSRNFGQDAACMAGYSIASGDYIITLDDDGQCPPKEAHKLLDKIEEGYDVVFADYYEKKQSKFKNWGSRFNDRMANVMLGKPKDLTLNSYFIFSKFVCNEIIKYEGSYPYIWGLLLRTTDRIANVDLEHHNRELGESTYTLQKMINYWLNGFTSFSVKPLRISMVLGGMIAIVGFMVTIVITIRTLMQGDVPGWTSLMATILILFGSLFIMLGLFGEYLGRLYLNQNKAPQFIIRDCYQREEKEAHK